MKLYQSLRRYLITECSIHIQIGVSHRGTIESRPKFHSLQIERHAQIGVPTRPVAKKFHEIIQTPIVGIATPERTWINSTGALRAWYWRAVASF